jgi:hypothetical protein
MKKRLLTLAQFLQSSDYASVLKLTEDQLGQLPVWEANLNITGVCIL